MKFHLFSILPLAFYGWCPLGGSAQATPREHYQNDAGTEATLLKQKQTGRVLDGNGHAKATSKIAMSRNATAGTGTKAKVALVSPVSRYYWTQSSRSGRSLQGGPAVTSDSLPTPGVGDDILDPTMDFEPNGDDPIFGTSVSISDDGNFIAIVGSVIVDAENDHYKSFAEVRSVTTGELRGQRVYTETNEHPALLRVLLSGNGMSLAVASIQRPSETFSDLKSGVQVYQLEYELVESAMIASWGKVGSFIEGGIAGEIPGGGLAIGMSIDGSSIVVGSRNFNGGKGRTRMFKLSANQNIWDRLLNYEGADEQFLGTSVAIDKDGDYIATGATGYDSGKTHRKGSVTVYDVVSGNQIGNVIVGENEDDECGFSVSLGRRSDTVLRVAIGAILNDPAEDVIDAGHVRIFEIDVSTESKWRQVGTDIDGLNGMELNFDEGKYHIGDYFGFSLDMSHDGTRVIIGSPFYSAIRESGYYAGRAAVYVFPDDQPGEISSTTDWEEFGDAVIGADKKKSSGFSVALARGGTNVIIGNGYNSGEGGNVSIYLETQVSESPSEAPSASSQPSMAPSAYSFRTFSIVSSFSKFATLDTTRDWCLKTQNITPDSSLKVRPCDTEVHKGRWYYEDEKIKLRRENEEPDDFCIKAEGRKLFLKNCLNVVDSQFYFGKEESNTISVEKNGKKLYFGIDTLKIFSRVRLFSAGNRNSSYNKWSVRYEGPSNAPSESRSISP